MARTVNIYLNSSNVVLKLIYLLLQRFLHLPNVVIVVQFFEILLLKSNIFVLVSNRQVRIISSIRHYQVIIVDLDCCLLFINNVAGLRSRNFNGRIIPTFLINFF